MHWVFGRVGQIHDGCGTHMVEFGKSTEKMVHTVLHRRIASSRPEQSMALALALRVRWHEEVAETEFEFLRRLLYI